jgi:hypothetical protein
MEHIDKAIPDFSKYILNQKNVNEKTFNILISENSFNSNSTIFIGSLIAYYLKNDFQVIFCGSNEGLIHYNTITKRYGVNMQTNLNLYYLDLFYSPYKHLIKEELPLGEIFPYTYNSVKSKNYYLIEGKKENETQDNQSFEDNQITETLEIMYKKLSENKSNKKTVLMFDNMTSIPIKDLYSFINKINFFCLEKDLNLIMGLNLKLLFPQVEGNFKKRNEFYSYLNYLCDLVFEFIENESGYSKDIDGKVVISIKSFSLENSWKLIYKIKENCIEFFNNLMI